MDRQLKLLAALIARSDGQRRQGGRGILSPVLYNIYYSDKPTSPNTLVADYADDKAIISKNHDPVIASHHLQITSPSRKTACTPIGG
ncbi:Uncharacterized protein FWK35_00037286 [Aphis craccivora]|uniref:Uncharacterized protein n=1 Tax=Aphis craccivora TaxID=307492 RepID=A0A6G0YL17_APHCR|nr:Uncharacterized protein FWK35_00037286 [Aphis craccivora]